jgi:hypothetical protein
MHFEKSSVLPCLTFFAAGRVVPGLLTLLMQMTVLFWPVAARMAREFDEARGLERMLSEISQSYKLPDSHHARARRSFRPADWAPAHHHQDVAAFGRRRVASAQVA